MNPRAAWRLEGLGFEKVYDHVPGKADWSASGLSLEGTLARVPKIGDVACTDVPTCAPSGKVGAVRRRINEARWDGCVVVSRSCWACCERENSRRPPKHRWRRR